MFGLDAEAGKAVRNSWLIHNGSMANKLMKPTPYSRGSLCRSIMTEATLDMKRRLENGVFVSRFSG